MAEENDAFEIGRGYLDGFDSYDLSLSAGQLYRIDFLENPDFGPDAWRLRDGDAYLGVFDADGNRYSFAVGGETRGFHVYSETDVETTLRLSGEGLRYTSEGAYRLVAVPVPTSSLDIPQLVDIPGDASSEAQLEPGIATEGYVHWGSDADAFHFLAGADTNYRITVEGPPLNFGVFVSDGDTEVTSRRGSSLPPSFDLILLETDAPRDLLVRTVGLPGQASWTTGIVGPYRLTVSEFVETSPETVVVGDSGTIAFEYDDDEDVVTLSAEAGVVYDLALTESGRTDDRTGGYVIVVDPDGEHLASTTFPRYERPLRFLSPVDQVVSIRFAEGEGENYDPDVTIGFSLTEWARDIADAKGTLRPGVPVAGVFEPVETDANTYRDTDVFEVTLLADRMYRVELSSADADLDISLRLPTGNGGSRLVSAESESITATKAVAEFLPPENGTYLLIVTGRFEGGSVPYDLDVQTFGTRLSASELIRGTPGDDILRGEDGNDTLRGATGDDMLRGGSGDDELNGGAGDDTLSGGEGDDVLRGGSGENLLRGGRGSDTFIYDRAADGRTRIVDFDPDEDFLKLDTVIPTAITLAPGGVFVEFADGSLTVEGIPTLDPAFITGAKVGSGGRIPSLVVAPEGGGRVFGTFYDDVLIGSGAADLVRGSFGADLMLGNGGADIFVFDASEKLGTKDVVDRIVDFELSVDSLRLNRLAASSVEATEDGVLIGLTNDDAILLLGLSDADAVAQYLDGL